MENVKLSKEEIGNLVRQAINGEKVAFDMLFRATYQSAFYYAKRFVKEEDAEEAVQEAYITAFLKLDTIDEPEKFVSWLHSIITYKCLHKVRSVVRIKENEKYSLDNENFSYPPEVTCVESFDNTIDRKETAEIISGIIDKLPEAQRQVVLLHYYDELTTAQIAKLLDINENTVKSRLMYARKRIEQAVKEEEKRGIKLYSLSPMLIVAAIRNLISAENVSEASVSAVAESIYKGIGLSGGAAAIKAAGAAKEISAAEAGTQLADAGVKAAADTGVKAAADTGVKAAADTGVKAAANSAVKAAAVKTAKAGVSAKVIAIVSAAAITVGGGVAAAIHISNKAPAEPSPVIETVSENEYTEDALVIMEETPEPTPVAELTKEISIPCGYKLVTFKVPESATYKKDDVCHAITNFYPGNSSDINGIYIFEKRTYRGYCSYSDYISDVEYLHYPNDMPFYTSIESSEYTFPSCGYSCLKLDCVQGSADESHTPIKWDTRLFIEGGGTDLMCINFSSEPDEACKELTELIISSMEVCNINDAKAENSAPADESSPELQSGAHSLVGEYRDAEIGEINLKISENGDGFNVDIGIYRLAGFSGYGTPSGDKIVFSAKDPAGNDIYGEIVPTEAGADVTFTDSTWAYIESGKTYNYYR